MWKDFGGGINLWLNKVQWEESMIKRNRYKEGLFPCLDLKNKKSYKNNTLNKKEV